MGSPRSQGRATRAGAKCRPGVVTTCSIALLLGGAAPVSESLAMPIQRAECQRSRGGAPARETRVVLRQGSSYPCVIVVDSASVSLSSAADPRVTNIERSHVARDRQGRFYTSTGRAQVTVWDTSGRYLATLGRAGLGPGEFASRWTITHIDRSDRVYVRDAGGRWSLFTPTLRFVRTTAPSMMRFDAERAVFLDDGTFLTSAPPSVGPLATANRPGHWFHVYDFAAEPKAGEGVAREGAFGPIAASDRPTGASRIFAERLITYAGGPTFWAGPPIGVGRGYELEMWEPGGDTPRRVIRREVAWFPAGSDRDPPPRGEGAPAVPVAQVAGLHDDGTGLLFVIAYVPNPRWTLPPRGPRTAQQYRDDYDSMYDVYVEVIDANALVVLASVGPMRPSQAREAYPVGYFPRSRLGFRFGETPEGHSVAWIIRVRLEEARR